MNVGMDPLELLRRCSKAEYTLEDPSTSVFAPSNALEPSRDPQQ